MNGFLAHKFPLYNVGMQSESAKGGADASAIGSGRGNSDSWLWNRGDAYDRDRISVVTGHSFILTID